MLDCEVASSDCAILARDQADEPGVAVDDAGSIIPANPLTLDSPGNQTVDRLIEKIFRQDKRLTKTEHDAVLAIVMKGQILTDLKACTARDWPRRSEVLDLHQRIATRLMRSSRWGKRIGLKESDLISGLPLDLLNLEWISKLGREQVQDLDRLAEFLPTVIKEVKKLLGQTQLAIKPTARTTTIEAIERRLSQLSPLIDRIDSASRDGEAAERVRSLLDDMARKLAPQPRE
jgi:hypothetical protein